METANHDLDELLDDALTTEPRPPGLVPWRWGAFLLLLAALDLVALLFGHVPFSGYPTGLNRGEALLGMIAGLALGLALGLLMGLAGSRRAAQLGITEEEAELAKGEFSLLGGPRGRTEVAGWLALVALFLLSGLFGRLVGAGLRQLAAHGFIFVNGLAGLALPMIWRRFLRANAVFRVWLDERNAPFDPGAAQRAAEHRARLADIRARIEAGEQALRERLDRTPRVPPPWYLCPEAAWLIPLPALVLDLVILFSPGARGWVHGSVGAALWGMLVHWIWGAIAIAILWALLSWYYVEVSDQVSRRWAGRDWSEGASSLALELALGLIALALLVGLVGGGGLRFACWNLVAPSFLLYGVLRDIRDTAREHYGRSLGKPPPVAAAEDEAEV